MATTLIINGQEEQLHDFPPEFLCEHLSSTSTSCNDGCYAPSVGGPWKCSNPSCIGHPSRYTDPCFGSRPWILPNIESTRWDPLREAATSAMPPGGEWALEIICDGRVTAHTAGAEIGVIAEEYESKTTAEEPIIVDMGGCAAALDRFVLTRRNRHELPHASGVVVEDNGGPVHSLNTDQFQDSIEAIERMSQKQLELVIEASMKTAELDQQAQQQAQQRRQDEEIAYMREQFLKIAQDQARIMEEREAIQQEKERQFEEDMRNTLANSVRDVAGRLPIRTRITEIVTTPAAVQPSGQPPNIDPAPPGAPPSYDESEPGETHDSSQI